MLATNYRFQVKNETGLNITAANLTLSYRPWKIDSNGALVYGTGVSLTPASDIANGSVENLTAQDNTTDLYLGLVSGHIVVQTDSGTLGSDPQVIVYVQTSPDGTDWPDDEEGWVAVVVPITTAAANERRDFEV